MRISKELVPLAYEVSKKVYEGELKLKDGQKKIVGKNRMNPNSAADYINNFRCMIEGRRFTRTNNAFSMEYFFDNIYRDYGSDGLTNALTALRLHIEYYEAIQNVNMKSMRNIYDKYFAMPLESKDEIEQKEILKELQGAKYSKEEILKELSNLKFTDTEEILINTRRFKRDNKTIAQIKYLRGFKCQICSTTIKKKDGSFYIEAAHIKPKHKKGRETPDNILLLCPNHHKEFDYGDRIVITHNKEKLHFSLNSKEYSISLKFN